MPKTALSVTLTDDNLLWLRGRAAKARRRSLSEALDDIVTAARTGGHGATASRSVVRSIDIADSDPDLESADTYVRTTFDTSTARPMLVREPRTSNAEGAPSAPRARKFARRG